MEALSPTLQLILALREAMESGQSLQMGLFKFIKLSKTNLAGALRAWWLDREAGRKPDLRAFNLYQKMTLQLIDRSLKGESVNAPLAGLQAEVLLACEQQAEEFVQILPLKCLLPLLGLIFPAYLMVLMGPLVEGFIKSLQH